MPQFHAVPDYAPLGSLFVAKTPDGRECMARFDDAGWTFFLAARPLTGTHARAQGYELHRAIHEGRRILYEQGGPFARDGDDAAAPRGGD